MVLEELLQSQILSIIQFVLVLAIGVIVTKLAADGLHRFLNKPEIRKTISDMGYDEPMIDLILIMARYVLYFITFIIALAQFGFAPIVFDVVIIIIGLFIVSILIYSLKDFVPNAAAGIYLSRIKSIKKGDRITVGAYHGVVQSITLMTLTLKDETGRIAIIQNANLTRRDIVIDAPRTKKKKNIKG
jgi:small-conductance mechanosensitive channel